MPQALTTTFDKPGITPQRAELAAFLGWLACWIVLPNLPFLPITLMGGPPRAFDIVLCGIVGLVARRLPCAFRQAAFLALMAYLVLAFIARMFNMHVSMILSVAGLVLEMSPANSMEYVVGAALLLACSGCALWLLRRDDVFFHRRWLLCATAVVIALAQGDHVASRDAMGAYSRVDPHGAPFSSATTQTGLAALADGRTNIMVVMVEAMGQPNDPALRKQLEAMWMRPELNSRFEVTHGQTPFFGSTTNGELRELCYRWGNYDSIDRREPNCLPALLARRGYRTSSWHAFTPEFFERNRWYPRIGFQHSVFGDEMMKQGASFCPNVFPGACDRDVPGLIGKALADSRQPQFIYWLTLNSHLPIVRNRELDTQNCHRLGAKLDSELPMICRLFTIWGNTADSLVKLTTRSDFPPTHILIVGDHMPPFTHQKSRLQFDPENVPWVLLRYKGSSPAE